MFLFFATFTLSIKGYFRLVDVHSHAGVAALPQLSGTDDSNSLKGIVQPYLRTLDGLNTHDEAYTLMRAGGVTSANILPGSANAIGIQFKSFRIKQHASAHF